MRLRRLLLPALLFVVAAPVLADDVVRFHDGRFLKVRDWSMEQGVARLVFSPGSYVIVPEAVIDVEYVELAAIRRQERQERAVAFALRRSRPAETPNAPAGAGASVARGKVERPIVP